MVKQRSETYRDWTSSLQAHTHLSPLRCLELLQAQAKGTKIINEDGLMALVKAAPAPKESLPLDADDSEDDVSFVSASAVPAGRASKLGAELNKLPASSKRPQPLGSNAGKSQ